jgi:diguanylate cyclase (GGDEF)-like protein/PAS domain S-box-containing protein
MKLFRPRLSPIARLSVGLVSLVICLVLMLDFGLGLFPDREQQARPLRQALAESIGAQLTPILGSLNDEAVTKIARAFMERHPELRSVAVFRTPPETDSGTPSGLRASSAWVVVGDHDRHFRAPADGRSSLTAIQLPVLANEQQWGLIALAFDPVVPRGLLGWVQEPAVLTIASLASLGLIAIYLYLRRALQFLDPGSAVPERVRAAFDTLSEGLLVIDSQGRCVLANSAMRAMLPSDQSNLTGRLATQVPWLSQPFEQQRNVLPWAKAMSSRQVVVVDSFIAVDPQQGATRKYVMKANPILDNHDKVRGCILTFDDVTELHQANQELKIAIEQLNARKQEVQQKAEALQRLAERDPLTGCLNRRAFFEALDRMRSKALEKGQTLSFIMCDVDHFKSFNDRFGHIVGDQVLQAMAKLLTKGCRIVEPGESEDQQLGVQGDLLVRMGGEEFCIALRGVSLAQARDRAEQLRLAVEQGAGALIESLPSVRVTASFGVVALPAKSVEPKQMLDLADQALYASKRSGRNRVTTWPLAMQPNEEDQDLLV